MKGEPEGSPFMVWLLHGCIARPGTGSPWRNKEENISWVFGEITKKSFLNWSFYSNIAGKRGRRFSFSGLGEYSFLVFSAEWT
jgi:hypothetical protein